MAISPQLPKYSATLSRNLGLEFPLLFDKDNHTAKKLGLAFALPGELRELYRSLGIDLELANGNDRWELPMPGRILIDPNGIVRDCEVHPDHTRRPEPEETLRLVRELSGA